MKLLSLKFEREWSDRDGVKPLVGTVEFDSSVEGHHTGSKMELKLSPDQARAIMEICQASLQAELLSAVEGMGQSLKSAIELKKQASISSGGW